MTRTVFRGYRREDGSVGVRNHVLVLPASVCASDVAEKVARLVPGCVTFHNQSGCSQLACDQALTMSVLVGYAANPNVAGVLVIGLGCEGCQASLVADAIRRRTYKPIDCLVIQEVGGTIATIDEGVRLARRLAARAAKAKRVECPVSELVLGTNCGGSDATSGLGSNPLLGRLSDMLVGAGATMVLCETTEFVGGEQVLARRAATPEVAARILEAVRGWEDYAHRFGEEIRDGNPSPGNVAGGITTLEEKSLGCIHKGGHAPINAFYEYAESIGRHEGLVVMDTPGNDPTSMAGIIAGGCQLVVFTTGRGTPTGNPIVPVYRMTANPDTYQCMRDNTDYDCSETIFGPRTMDALASELWENVLDVCDGRETRAESLGFVETALPHLCNFM